MENKEINFEFNIIVGNKTFTNFDEAYNEICKNFENIVYVSCLVLRGILNSLKNNLKLKKDNEVKIIEDLIKYYDKLHEFLEQSLDTHKKNNAKLKIESEVETINSNLIKIYLKTKSEIENEIEFFIEIKLKLEIENILKIIDIKIIENKIEIKNKLVDIPNIITNVINRNLKKIFLINKNELTIKINKEIIKKIVEEIIKERNKKVKPNIPIINNGKNNSENNNQNSNVIILSIF